MNTQMMGTATTTTGTFDRAPGAQRAPYTFPRTRSAEDRGLAAAIEASKTMLAATQRAKDEDAAEEQRQLGLALALSAQEEVRERAERERRIAASQLLFRPVRIRKLIETHHMATGGAPFHAAQLKALYEQTYDEELLLEPGQTVKQLVGAIDGLEVFTPGGVQTHLLVRPTQQLQLPVATTAAAVAAVSAAAPRLRPRKKAGPPPVLSEAFDRAAAMQPPPRAIAAPPCSMVPAAAAHRAPPAAAAAVPNTGTAHIFVDYSNLFVSSGASEEGAVLELQALSRLLLGGRAAGTRLVAGSRPARPDHPLWREFEGLGYQVELEPVAAAGSGEKLVDSALHAGILHEILRRRPAGEQQVRQRSSLLKAVITAFLCVSLPFLAVPLRSQRTVAISRRWCW
eukprot:SAG22_NODE_2104_length_3006_cov_2.293430_2_plen_398_part_00